MAELNEQPVARLAQQAGRGGEAVIVLAGELDIASAEAARGVLADALEHEPGSIVFEMAEVSFMDSSGIAVLVTAANRVPAVVLRNPRDLLRRTLEITGLTGTFTFEP